MKGSTKRLEQLHPPPLSPPPFPSPCLGASRAHGSEECKQKQLLRHGGEWSCGTQMGASQHVIAARDRST
eukprot:2417228-Rhodomonas_salina.1